MKKSLFTLLLLAVIVNSAWAQAGLRVGLNNATIGGDASGVKAKSGFHAGFFIMKRGEHVGTMFEILYSTQGAQSSSGSTSIDYNYIQLPFLVNFYLSKEIFAQVGVQPGILVSGQINGTSVQDQLNTFDFAGALGLGADLDQFLINARYNMGFTSTSKQSSGSFPNMVFQLSLGFKFSKKEKG